MDERWKIATLAPESVVTTRNGDMVPYGRMD